MALLDYTTYADVRAALGVNDVELTDDTLGLDLYSSNLNVELDDVDTTLADKFAEVNGVPAEQRTKAQQRLFDTTRTFATYVVAKQCCGSIAMFGPKSVSDSKAEVSRFTNDPYKDTAKNVTKLWETYRLRVTNALASLQSSTTSRTALGVFLVSSPTVDEVTGS
jgi:hypothetical protein